MKVSCGPGALPGRSVYTFIPCLEAPPEPEHPFHDRTVRVTRCGRICVGKRKINLSNVFAGQLWATERARDAVTHRPGGKPFQVRKRRRFRPRWRRRILHPRSRPEPNRTRAIARRTSKRRFLRPLHTSPIGKILLAGDAHDATWDYVLRHYETAASDVDLLIAPHHGRKSGRSYEFLAIPAAPFNFRPPI